MIESVYEDSMGPFAEDDTSGDLLKFMLAIGGPLDSIYGIVGEGPGEEPGWSSVFDLTRAPTNVLPWTAQFVGSTITPAMTDADARSAIRTPDGFAVGTVAAIRAAAERTLTGTKRVIIHERTPDWGDLYIRTLLSETPDEAATLRAIRAQVPWHLQSTLNYQAVTGLTYIDVDAEFDDYDELSDADLTYSELAEMLP